MSTPLTDRIEALTASANAVTGESDITLTDAVGRLIAGFGTAQFWKTVIINENHQAANIANPVYWMEYFEIPEQEILDGTIFLLEIANGSEYATISGNWHIWPYSIYYKDKSGAVNNVACRTNTAIQGMSTNNYQYISTGAVVNIYKFRMGGAT